MDPNGWIHRVPVKEPEPERHDHSDQSDGRRASADTEHFLEVSLEADLEQENRDPDLGEDVDDLVHLCAGVGDDTQHAASQDDARDQLAQDCRLPPSFDDLAEDLARKQDEDENEEHVPDPDAVIRITGY